MSRRSDRHTTHSLLLSLFSSSEGCRNIKGLRVGGLPRARDWRPAKGQGGGLLALGDPLADPTSPEEGHRGAGLLRTHGPVSCLLGTRFSPCPPHSREQSGPQPKCTPKSRNSSLFLKIPRTQDKMWKRCHTVENVFQKLPIHLVKTKKDQTSLTCLKYFHQVIATSGKQN